MEAGEASASPLCQTSPRLTPGIGADIKVLVPLPNLKAASSPWSVSHAPSSQPWTTPRRSFSRVSFMSRSPLPKTNFLRGMGVRARFGFS